MSISYSLQTTITVPDLTGLSIDVRTVISPTTRVFAVRTFFDVDAGTRKNFFNTPTYYGVGQIVGKWEGYVVYHSYLEFPRQFHFLGYATDVQSEISFLYPDSTSVVNPERTTETSKVSNETEDPVYEYDINQDSTNFLGTSVTPGDSVSNTETDLKSFSRCVLKAKNRLYSNAIPVDEIEVEVARATGGVIIDLLQIR